MKKYPSIENADREKFILKCKDILDNPDYIDIKFAVSEKIHGSNISIEFDKNNETIKVYSRTQEVTESNFGNFKKVFERDSIIQKLIELINVKYPENNLIIFYGEIFGGLFNGESNGTVIQRIDYHPENQIMFFDIFVDDKFENFLVARDYIEMFGLKFVPILKEDITFNEALEYPNEFISKVPKIFGLDSQTIAEGVVLRPEKELYVTPCERFILKNKTESFKESKVNEDSSKYNIRVIARDFLTEARVNSAISKLSTPNLKDVSLLVIDDIIEELRKKHEDAENNEEFNPAKIRKAISCDVFNYVRNKI